MEKKSFKKIFSIMLILFMVFITTQKVEAKTPLKVKYNNKEYLVNNYYIEKGRLKVDAKEISKIFNLKLERKEFETENGKEYLLIFSNDNIKIDVGYFDIFGYCLIKDGIEFYNIYEYMNEDKNLFDIKNNIDYITIKYFTNSLNKTLKYDNKLNLLEIKDKLNTIYKVYISEEETYLFDIEFKNNNFKVKGFSEDIDDIKEKFNDINFEENIKIKNEKLNKLNKKERDLYNKISEKGNTFYMDYDNNKIKLDYEV